MFKCNLLSEHDLPVELMFLEKIQSAYELITEKAEGHRYISILTRSTTF
jgi:hypothetical protein